MEVRRLFFVAFRLIFLLEGGVLSLRNLSISVPRAVLATSPVELRCGYELEGAALYSARWYRADTEFYRYVPREDPPALVFPLPHATVDVSRSDAERVSLAGAGRALSGVFSCEVSADAPLFHTDIRTAMLTVVEPPTTPPHLSLVSAQYTRGSIIRADCRVGPSYPPVNITWIVDGREVGETVSPLPPEGDTELRAVTSQLELEILEPHAAPHLTSNLEPYSALYSTNFGDQFGFYPVNKDKSTTGQDNVVIARVAAPAGGRMHLVCAARALGVWERDVSAELREDAPRPASVTRDFPAAGTRTSALAPPLLLLLVLLL